MHFNSAETILDTKLLVHEKRSNYTIENQSADISVCNYHNFTVRRAIHAFKFNGIKIYSGYFAGIIHTHLVTHTISFNPDSIITYVPMHPHKQMVRGYNQSELLARELGKLINMPVEQTLIKYKNTPAQLTLSKTDRKINLEGAFAAFGNINSRHFILIDDVITTGSTFAECKETLLLAGAASVICLAFAKD